MAKPSEKAPAITQFLDRMMGRTAAIIGNVCVRCHKSAKIFKDEISAREYRISGYCQECQDWLEKLGEGEEENAESPSLPRTRKLARKAGKGGRK